MHKRELITVLKDFVANGFQGDDREWNGQREFAAYFIHYLEHLEIPQDEEYDFWRIEPYLPKILVWALEELRTSGDEEVKVFRVAYEKAVERQVPNVIDIGASNITQQVLTIQTIFGFMLKRLLNNDWIESKIEKYCGAQSVVLQQAFDTFSHKVYCKDLFKTISECTKRGMSGRIGDVDLRVWTGMGRTMFTFARPVADGAEHLVSFVAEEEDRLCLGAGIQGIGTDFRTALNMIDVVTEYWPQDKSNFVASKTVSIFKGLS